MINHLADHATGDNTRSSKEMATYLATVRYAFPWMNLYVVSPHNRGLNMSRTELVSGQDRKYGSAPTAYNVGDIVMVNSDRDNPDSWSLTDYIVGIASSDNVYMDQTVDISEEDKKKYPVWSTLKYVFDRLKGMFPLRRMDISKTYIDHNDSLPGEVHITTKPDVGIHALKHIIQIKCGRRNMVELDSVLNRIRIVTEKIEYIGPLRNSQDLSGVGSLLKYEQEALTPIEGSAYGDKADYALYRNRKVSGDITMGWSEAVSVPSIDTHTTNDVFRKKINYDGQLELTSAKGFTFKKSLDVVSVLPITEDHDTLDKTPELNPLALAALQDSRKNRNDKDIIFDRTINLKDARTYDRSFEFVHTESNTDAWATTDSTRSPEVSKAVTEANARKLQPIGTNQYYDLPEVVELTDPHTGVRYTYYKADSGILYEPDGSLVFYDGYGSEIRMTRGNIIISPAADLILRPGRDTHVMSGRHTAVVSQKDVTIHSSLSDVYIKAQKDLKIISGLDSNGVFHVENRGTGMNLRANNNVAITGKDVFIGNTPNRAPDNLDGYVEGEGTVTIGSGNQTNIVGSTIATKCDEFIAIAGSGSANSFMVLNQDTAIIHSDTVCLSGGLHIGYFVGSTNVTIRGETFTLSSAYTSQIVFNVPVYTKAGLLCDYIQADNGAFRLLVANNADGESGMMPRTPVDSVEWPSFAITDPALIPMGNSAIPSDVDRNIFVYGNTFKYPSSADIGINTQYIIPGMLWQTIASTGMVWEETPIPGLRDKDAKTMVYPGIEAWDKATVTVSGYKTTKINGGYVVNG